jgi:excisionase family DNA binding protein
MTDRPSPYATAEEAAEFLNVPLGTLRDWRYRGIGPPAARFGKGLRYRRTDLARWAEGQFAEPEDVGSRSSRLRTVKRGGSRATG